MSTYLQGIIDGEPAKFFTSASKNGDCVVTYDNTSVGVLHTKCIVNSSWTALPDVTVPTVTGDKFSGLFAISGDGQRLFTAGYAATGTVNIYVRQRITAGWASPISVITTVTAYDLHTQLIVSYDGSLVVINSIDNLTKASEFYLFKATTAWPAIPHVITADRISCSNDGTRVVCGTACGLTARGKADLLYYDNGTWLPPVSLDAKLTGRSSTRDGLVTISGDGLTVVCAALLNPPRGSTVGTYSLVRYQLAEIGNVAYAGVIGARTGCGIQELPAIIQNIVICTRGENVLVYGVDAAGGMVSDLYTMKDALWRVIKAPATVELITLQSVSAPRAYVCNNADAYMITYATPNGVERSSILK